MKNGRPVTAPTPSDAAIEAAAREFWNAMHAVDMRPWPRESEGIRLLYEVAAEAALNAAYAVDAPDDTDLATRVQALADEWDKSPHIARMQDADDLRALVGEATGPTLHDRIKEAMNVAENRVLAKRNHGAVLADLLIDLRAALAHDTGEPR
jgi:hypothetical protein